MAVVLMTPTTFMSVASLTENARARYFLSGAIVIRVRQTTARPGIS